MNFCNSMKINGRNNVCRKLYQHEIKKKKKMIDTHLILDATINGTSSERFDK